MNKKIKVAGVGCCLVDRLYTNIPFTSKSFSRYLSKERGDGGLTPGHLVFKEEFEKFSGVDFQSALKDITKNNPPDKINIGGPSIVALIHAAQTSGNPECQFKFYGSCGQDTDGDFLLCSLQNTPVNIDNYEQKGKVTPSTVVLSDPDFDGGNGERIFINSIGTAWDYLPEKLGNDFFDSDMVVFGGTALVPPIHDNLFGLLGKAKAKGCINVVNTVFDFRNEKASPGKKWPMGDSDESYRFIDLLITDHEEALRLSGEKTADNALQFFRNQGTGAVVITNGSKNICAFAEKEVFKTLTDLEMPVSNAIKKELSEGHIGDTTGCGDNFVGGVVASLISQLNKGSQRLDLTEACAWGIVSGGFSCFYVGGTYFERYPGEKLEKLRRYYKTYLAQTR